MAASLSSDAMRALTLPPGPREPSSANASSGCRPGAAAPLRRRPRRAFTLRLRFDDAPLVLVWRSLQAVRDVWAADPAILRAGEGPGPLGAIAGRRSILVADGAEHLRMRRLMLPPFHGERMAALRGEVEAIAGRRRRALADRPVALLGELQRLTLDVILRAAFGVRDERLAAEIRATLALATSLPRLAAMSVTPLGWRAFRRRLAVVDAALNALIAERRARAGEGTDILSLLLATRDERDRPLDDEEVRDHLVTLIAAGHDTTAGAAAWAVDASPGGRVGRPSARWGRRPAGRRGPRDAARAPRADDDLAQARGAAACRRPRPPPAGRARHPVHLPRASPPRRLPPTPRRGCPGAGSASTAPCPTAPPGSPSAARCAAVWGPRSPSWSCARCCAR